MVPARKLPKSLILPPKFYQRDTVTVAKNLLGKRLVRIWRGKRLSGLIVETEAYLGAKDAAAHSYNGRNTERIRSMFLPGGHVYVYLIYGMHYCMNVVTKGEGEPEAILVRALEPEAGVVGRTDGPGRLCKALKIGLKQDGLSLAGPIMFIEQTGRSLVKEEIGAGPRIGVEYAGEAANWPLRFTWKAHPHLSRKEKGKG
jgi:DNA-3-methyladenine glycosylase